MKTGSLLLASVALLLGTGTVTAQQAIVTDAWVAEVPPVSRVSAAYMKIENPTAVAWELVGGVSPAARVVELHEMKMAQGLMKMAKIERVVIPAHGAVTLKPGGFHLMLIDLKSPLHAGEALTVTLHFKNGRSLEVSAIVRKVE